MTRTAPTRRARPPGRARARVLAAIALVVLLALACAGSLVFGSREVALADALAALLDPQLSDIGSIAVRERIPRTVLAVMAGAALGLSGALLQAVTRNPLAEPGILGVNTGASLAVVCGIAFFGASTGQHFLVLALIGAALTAVLVFAIGGVGTGGATPVRLALAGAATTAALSSLVSAVLLPRLQAMEEFRFWQVGDVSRAQWDVMLTVAPVIGIAALVGLVVAPLLDVLALGDDVARGLGVSATGVRVLGAGAGIALGGAATAAAGPIAFVGLAVPHVLRILVGSSQRWLLPLSMLGGATLLVAADLVGRVVARPAELESGIVTAIVGAPVLVLVAMRMRGRQ